MTEVAVNAIVGLLATLFVLFGTGAWSSKENAKDHAADVAAIVELQNRTLDVVCDTPQNRDKRACSSPRPELVKK